MKLRKIRNALLVVLTLALVSATTVAITWAATNAKFTAKENEFTSNPDISIQLAEPTFDSLNWGTERGDSDSNVPTGTGAIPDDENHVKPRLPDGSTATNANQLGYNLAKNYISGQFIPKDPKIKNNSDHNLSNTGNKENNGTSSDEWVALGVSYSMVVPADAFQLAPTGNDGKDGLTQANAYLVTPVESSSNTGGLGGATITFPTYTKFASTIATVRYVADGQSGATTDETTTDGIRKSASPTGVEATWKDISGGNGTRFMYNKKLVKDQVTEPLFDYVRIRDISEVFTTTNGQDYTKYYCIPVYGNLGDTDQNGKLIFVSALPEFKIELKGYAVQGDNVLYSEAPDALNAFIDSVA